MHDDLNTVGVSYIPKLFHGFLLRGLPCQRIR